MDADLLDLIYESAANPEVWEIAIEFMARQAGAPSGSLICFNGAERPTFRAAPYSRDALAAYVANGDWRENARQQSAMPFAGRGFFHISDVMPPEVLERDSTTAYLRRLGLGEQVGAPLALPLPEAPVMTLERRFGEGRFSAEAIAGLDALAPHITRAAMIAVRLGLEAARAATAALQAIGLAAGVLDGSGRLIAANALFSDSDATLRAGAFDRVSVLDAAADVLFQAAIREHRLEAPVVRSIAVPSTEARGAAIVHVVPLKRTASDIFANGDMLVVVTPVGAARQVPEAPILRGLFDLTPSEARIAISLAAGAPLRDAAKTAGLTEKSARTYLDRIFEKTGRRRQSDLVALLQDTRPLGGG